MCSEMVFNAIKDTLLRFNLQLENCRGQTSNSPSTMLGKKSGVATRLATEQPKAPVVHYDGYPSLSLEVEQLSFS